MAHRRMKNCVRTWKSDLSHNTMSADAAVANVASHIVQASADSIGFPSHERPVPEGTIRDALAAGVMLETRLAFWERAER